MTLTPDYEQLQQEARAELLAEYIGRLYVQAPPEQIATRLLSTSPVRDQLDFHWDDAKCRRSFATAITNSVVGRLTQADV